METKLAPKLKIGMDDFHAATCKVAQQVIDSKVKYDFIIAPCRGGLIPGVYLSHQLTIPLIPIQWATRDYTEFNTEQFPNVSMKNVLLMEDIIDSGETAAFLKFKFRFAKRCDVAAIIENVGQTKVPVEYSGITFDKREEDRWVEFWWERRVFD